VIGEASGQERALLFIDEIHRFSKSQQDSLLNAVEKGIVTLIGATTENPSFEVISPLLSRCQVYILKPLEEHHLMALLQRATQHYARQGITLVAEEPGALLRVSGGDARKLYNAVELLVSTTGKSRVSITLKSTQEVIQQNLAFYDKAGEMHYDIISAFIKSIRGSDPNAAVYWLARMVESGEDPKFIARRMLILASEDIGNANPNAFLLANACFDAVVKTGWPEARILLSQCAIYLSCSVKSNASYQAILRAQQAVKENGDLPVPLPLRNAPTSLMKNLDYGKNYQYSHDYEHNFSPQEYLPEKLSGTVFYQPGNNKRENESGNWLKFLWRDKYNY